MSQQTTKNDDESLDCLIKMYEAQAMMATDTAERLKELQSAREELRLYRQREALRLQQNNPDLKGEVK